MAAKKAKKKRKRVGRPRKRRTKYVSKELKAEGVQPTEGGRKLKEWLYDRGWTAADCAKALSWTTSRQNFEAFCAGRQLCTLKRAAQIEYLTDGAVTMADWIPDGVYDEVNRDYMPKRRNYEWSLVKRRGQPMRTQQEHSPPEPSAGPTRITFDGSFFEKV